MRLVPSSPTLTRRLAHTAAALLVLGFVTQTAQLPHALAARPPSFVATPLNDLGPGYYVTGKYSYQGGLYENGTNTDPADHSTDGMAAAANIQPLDSNGNPSPSGKIVLLSIGMSNTADEWCIGGTSPDNSYDDCGYTVQPALPSFMSQAAASSTVNHRTLVIVNGAQGREDASTWTSPTDANYDMVRDQRLATAGVTEAQVQAVWLKDADIAPKESLSSGPTADAYTLERYLGDIVRAMKVRYPHLQEVFISSRVYGGYAGPGTVNPEPYAYESGFSVKWLIQAQVNQMRTGKVDPIAGDLNYDRGKAPWIDWASYVWADGTRPRSDGLTWQMSDFNPDYVHLNANGVKKSINELLPFFETSPYTKCWFDAAGC
jgi:hypothetical protein